MKKSYISLISSMLIFGTIGIFRRYIPLPSAFLAMARGIIGSLLLLLFLKATGRTVFHKIGWKKTGLLVLIGAIIGFNWVLLFEAYNYTTVATATLCYYMEPTIVILLSPLIFKERLTPKKLVCALTAIGGMILISGFADGEQFAFADLKGIFLGLAAAALYSAAVILCKIFSDYDPYERTVIQLFSAGAVLIPYLALTGGFTGISFGIDIRAVLLTTAMVFLVGFLHTGVAYALYFSSMSGVKAQSIAILSYIDPISALLLSALFLHEPITLSGMIGAVLVIGAAMISEL